MRALTVEEAAYLLGVSRVIINRWCADGTIPATQVDGAWIIHDQRIEQFGRLDPLDPPVDPHLDFKLALEQIRSLDFNEEWIPDIVRHEDHLTASDKVLEAAERKYTFQIADVAKEIEVPKASFFARTGHMLSIADRVVFHAIVGSFVKKIDSDLSGVVFSARLAPPGSRTLLRKGVKQWKRWTRYVRSTVMSGYPWLIKTDLAAYFDCIRHETLLNELAAIGVEDVVRQRLKAFLDSWSNVPGQGLPQGPDVARVLGNFYLAPVDKVMLSEGFKYSRYMDDVRIAGSSKAEVIKAVRRFGTECKKRGLVISSSKTQILHGKEAESADIDADRDQVVYLMDTRQPGRARLLLREMLEDALADENDIKVRATRFSLWRLALLRDETVCAEVLSRLDDLAPVASVVADYLGGYISRRPVQDGLSKYLDDDESVRDNYLLAFIFATMLEHSGIPASSWIDHARSVVKDRNLPDYLRIIASNVLALGRQPSDLTWLRSETRRETDTSMVRGYATALRRAGHLDPTTVAVLRSRSEDLARTASYLISVHKLPSLVRPYTRSKTYRQLQ